MSHVVTDACIKCKYTDCVEVCPVDCFHEGKKMLVINPLECIDCGVCVAECPVQAIKPESSDLVKWLERAKKFSSEWPRITQYKDPEPDADQYANEENKFEKYMEEDDDLDSEYNQKPKKDIEI
jgi:ferredoxin